jgi:hypothetical protein
VSSEGQGTNDPSRGPQRKGRFGTMLISAAVAVPLGVAWMFMPGCNRIQGGILIVASGLVVLGFALLLRRIYR